ncbi:hypothetical protein G6F31_012810 [Rhizopus arrhizus]|nr:hypothetical protein G6F31_012810 [Rhizopus arrhizus]
MAVGPIGLTVPLVAQRGGHAREVMRGTHRPAAHVRAGVVLRVLAAHAEHGLRRHLPLQVLVDLAVDEHRIIVGRGDGGAGGQARAPALVQRALYAVAAEAPAAKVAFTMGQAQVPTAVAVAAGHVQGLHVALAEAVGVVGMVQLHRNTVYAGMGAGHSQQQGARQRATEDQSHGVTPGVSFHGDARSELAARCDDATGQDDHADAQRGAFTDPRAKLVALAVDAGAADVHGDRRAIQAMVAGAHQRAKVGTGIDTAVADEALRTDADAFADQGVLQFAGKADAGAIADAQRATQQRVVADQAIAADRYRALQMGPVADAAAGTDAHSAPHGCAWRHLGAGINVGCQCRERIGQGGEVIPPHAGTSSACQQYIQHREGGGRHQPGAAMMDGADQRQQHDHAYPEQRHHRQCQAGGPMQHRRAEPDLQGQHDAGQRQQHHRQDAEQAEAAQQQAAMQAHADRIADDPAPPSSPFLHQRVALLRVDHAAHALAHTVTLRDQRPGHVQVFHAGAVGEADLAQHRGAEQAARAGDDERRAAQPLLEAALDHDHRQFQAGTHMRQEAGALQAGRGHAADRIGATLDFVQQVSQAMPARIDMGVGVGQEHLCHG